MILGKIKCISRYWLYPNGTGVIIDKCYQVGVLNVNKIYQNELGSFNVEFKTGEIISVTDVQYVEYFSEEVVKENATRPEFPEDRKH